MVIWNQDFVIFLSFYLFIYLYLFFQKDDFPAISAALRRYLPETDTPFLLDVDLDFFSTKNPFQSLYERAGLYDRLAPLYAFERPRSSDPVVS